MFDLNPSSSVSGKASAILLIAAAAAVARADQGDVLAIARSYPDGGGYNRTWAGSGTPAAVMHRGQQVLATGTDGTYCCGFTFCVAMQALQQRGLLNDKSFAEVKHFQKLWYGATELKEDTLCVLAVETLGVGQAVALEDSQPGDFLQLWRTNGSGHSVIFLEWIEQSGTRVGFRYRSSQGSTAGIADAVEYFSGVSGAEGRVDRSRTFACRLNSTP
ncbi:hypothetical protein [Botrimarina hoheduenensis]|uniref:Peptidase C51 domain-containing protein n=1 Tax=Botrimarina hoheduenensis TaxID=2528000 RepID=A0A5C5VRY0_9BACT|nr:hypothetical protein [Botrimarina hoheduenensis]TWT41404.1 hypothetical protein Pla111_31190 [Botrimarina hoheduenensis]